jgi:hypothetical protein
MKALKGILTGKDNETHDIARWSWVLTTLTIMGGAAWNARQGSLDLMQFAQAIGIVVTTHGAALLMKKDTEPVTATKLLRDDKPT